MEPVPASAPILSTATLRDLERRHAEDDLMERAGEAAAAWALELCTEPTRPVLVIAGPGNNGGDALVVARLLKERFFDVRVVLAADPMQFPPDARRAWERLSGMAIPVEPAFPIASTNYGLIVDGLFGIGLSRPIEGPCAQLVREMNEAARRSRCPLLALDCPSGLDGETGQARHNGSVVRASHTITFIALKAGLLTGSGPEYCGEVRLARLGLAAHSAAGDGRRIGFEDIAGALKRRARDSHKGSNGSAGVLGGARGMLGAALLAGRAALHMGTGRVFLGLLDPAAPAVDLAQPELMLRDSDGLFAAPLTAIAVGPGLGTSPEAALAMARVAPLPVPVALDADAINLVAAHPELRTSFAARGRNGHATVLTPHPAEAARLLDCPVDAVQADRIASARRIAREFAAWTALKGAGTVIASPEEAWWINASGNPALATAGTGDVLTGVVVSLLAQGIEPGAALRCAVHLHGAAADAVVADWGGESGMVASELIPATRRLFNRWIGG